MTLLLLDSIIPRGKYTTRKSGGGGVMGSNTDSPIILHASFALVGGCFLVSFSVLLMIVGAFAMSFCTCGASLIFIPLLAPLLLILPLFCL